MANQSEVALLREWINREVEALQQLKNGFAAVASHEVITHHYEILDVCFKGLAEHMGEEQAIDEICRGMEELK